MNRLNARKPGERIRGVRNGLNGNAGSDTLMDTGSAARFFYCSKANKHDRAGSKHPAARGSLFPSPRVAPLPAFRLAVPFSPPAQQPAGGGTPPQAGCAAKHSRGHKKAPPSDRCGASIGLRRPLAGLTHTE